MKITILTLFPEMLRGFFQESIVKRAIERKQVEIELVNIRDFSTDAYKTVDDKPYGGGAGMVLRVDVLERALSSISSRTTKPTVILTSAKGKRFSQRIAQDYSKRDHLILIAGHYEAVDERILARVDEEISLGDFVLTGGEIATAAIVDAVVRLLPGVLKKEEATAEESFRWYAVQDLLKVCGDDPAIQQLSQNGVTEVQLLEYPHYTRPEDWNGDRVPDVLLSGNHAAIKAWRIKQSLEMTKRLRPDLLA